MPWPVRRIQGLYLSNRAILSLALLLTLSPMVNTSSPVPTATNPEEELAAVVTALAQLTVDATIRSIDLNGVLFSCLKLHPTDLVLDKPLTKLIVDMTRLCLEVQGGFVSFL